MVRAVESIMELEVEVEMEVATRAVIIRREMKKCKVQGIIKEEKGRKRKMRRVLNRRTIDDDDDAVKMDDF